MGLFTTDTSDKNLQPKWAGLPVTIYSICTPDDGWDCRPKHVKKAIAENKTQLLHPVGLISLLLNSGLYRRPSYWSLQKFGMKLMIFSKTKVGIFSEVSSAMQSISLTFICILTRHFISVQWVNWLSPQPTIGTVLRIEVLLHCFLAIIHRKKCVFNVTYHLRKRRQELGCVPGPIWTPWRLETLHLFRDSELDSKSSCPKPSKYTDWFYRLSPSIQGYS